MRRCCFIEKRDYIILLKMISYCERIQHNLETKLARAVISGEIRDGWKVCVVVDRTEDGGTLRFERVEE